MTVLLAWRVVYNTEVWGRGLKGDMVKVGQVQKIQMFLS